MKNIIFSLLIMNICCDKTSSFKTWPNDEINHHLIVLAKTKEGVRLKGFKKSTPKDTTISLVVDDYEANINSLDDGSFDVHINIDNIKATTGKIIFNIGIKKLTHTYKIKDLDLSIKNISQKPFITGDEIDAILFNNNTAYILSSNASLLKKYSLDNYWQFMTKPDKVWLLNTDNHQRWGLRDIALINNNNMLFSLSHTHEIMLFNIDDEVIKHKSRLKNSQGQLFSMPVDPPLRLDKPLSDEEGVNIITKSSARNTESILALDDNYFLSSFTNYYQYADKEKKAKVGLGVLGLLKILDNKIITIDTLVLPYKNPLQIMKGENNDIVILCSGVWQFAKNHISTNDSGIVVIEIANDILKIKNSIKLTDFAPARFSMIKNYIIVPRLLGNDILVLDKSDLKMDNTQIKSLTYHHPLKFTFAQAFSLDHIMIGDHQGSLIIYSLSEGFLPFPFINPIPLDTNNNINLFPLDAYTRPVDASNHSMGYDFWINTSIHRLYPLDMGVIFGP